MLFFLYYILILFPLNWNLDFVIAHKNDLYYAVIIHFITFTIKNWKKKTLKKANQDKKVRVWNLSWFLHIRLDPI